MLRTRLRTGATGFNPGSLFGGSAAGIWLDPSDISTGYQLAASAGSGNIAHTATGQPTGLRLDKRLGLARGAELVPGGTATGWTPGLDDAVAVVGSALRVSNIGAGAANCFASYNVTTVVGQTYIVSGTLDANSDGSVRRLAMGSSPGTQDLGFSDRTTVGTYTSYYFTATATTSVLNLTAFGIPAGAYGDFTYSVKAVSGNHVLQATALARPEYTVASEISSDFMDGSDDKLATATFVAGTLTAAMDCFIAIKRADATSGEIVGSANGDYFGFYSNGSPSAAAFGVGAPSSKVNGVSVAGSTAGDLHTALSSGAWKVLEYTSLNLSDWTDFRISEIDFVVGDIGGVILCPTQNDATRAQIRRWLGRKVGLSL